LKSALNLVEPAAYSVPSNSARGTYVIRMLIRLLITGAILVSVTSGPVAAQFMPPPPELENRIPKPLPPPPQPPIINGPQGQGPSPGVIRQPRIDSAGDRASRCLHEGAGYGLRGGDLARYSRACANAN
jgi:hypothetical protein